MSEIRYTPPVGTGSGTTPDLQQVCNVGNTTDTSILLEDGTGTIITLDPIGNAVTVQQAGTSPIYYEMQHDRLSMAGLTDIGDPTEINQVLDDPTRLAAGAISVTWRNNGNNETVAYISDIMPFPNSRILPISSVAVSQAVSAVDYTLLCNCAAGNIVITLPNIAGLNGYVFNIKKIDATVNTVTIQPAAGTIDSVASVTLTLQGQSRQIQKQNTGTAWWIIAGYL